VSSFLAAYQHIMLGYVVTYDGVDDVIKQQRYNQHYLAKENIGTTYSTSK